MSATSTRVRCGSRPPETRSVQWKKHCLVRALHHLEGIHKINRMQQILKRLDIMQHSLYWLSDISRGHSLNQLSLRGFALDSIESNSSCKHVAAFGQAATGPDYP